jgi:hypothetical protein
VMAEVTITAVSVTLWKSRIKLKIHWTTTIDKLLTSLLGYQRWVDNVLLVSKGWILRIMIIKIVMIILWMMIKIIIFIIINI